MKTRFKTLLFLIFFLSISIHVIKANKIISLDDLKNKIAGAWIGQMVGNIYGLPFENKFIENPGNKADWPYGYSKNLTKLQKYDGAFSDDDTDVEYMYLIMMEKYGIEPTYAQIREGWMYHIRDRVWLANRAALGLMHHGFTPPFTGNKNINPHWYQIDPQLINEIWGYTAPGMLSYAAGKSDWAAHITSDDWATSPTIHYGVMYANAFFESNMEKLILNALQYLPAQDRYTNIVKEMIALYKKYPNDWEKARAIMADEYYVHEPDMTKTIWNSNLNGACGILAMLYGGGDLQKTMDLGCAMGFDCDNQTATIGGILGVINGVNSFPDELTKPIKGWTLPFNDKYINITRYDLPDASIQDIIERTVKQTISLVCNKGGKIVYKKDKPYLSINTNAVFTPPMEFCVGPMPRLEINKPINFDFACQTNRQYNWSLVKGDLPEGVIFENGKLMGTPTKAGVYPITLSLSDNNKIIKKDFLLIVRSKNIAPEADSILTNAPKVNKDVLYNCWITFGKPMYADSVNVINDGILSGEGSVFYSLLHPTNLPKIDYFGYEWKIPKRINMMAYHTGCMEEFGGWFSSLGIEYKDQNGHWQRVENMKSMPELPKTDEVFIQPHFVEFLFEFKPVTTTAIRLVGDAKVQSHWHKYTKNISSFISITELSVYEK